ncbi:MAG TPA: TIGR03435 family protein [Candidatus Sulfopaludibacter sp.]|nr:TIGR03435 family protein [Candidatus Sulfopaludibacter sp.]
MKQTRSSLLHCLMAPAVLLCCIAATQDTFEVASVKPTDPNDPIVAWHTYPGGRVVITNYTLTQLIEAAYDVSLYRIIGGPYWAARDFYSINAKAPAGSVAATLPAPKPSSPEFRSMMQNLLADRFGLKVHRETRELPVYALVVNRGGSKLHAANNPSEEPEHSIRRGEIQAHNRDIPWLAMVLERHFQRTVLDHTELKSSYDFDIKFDPLQRDSDVSADAPVDPNRPSLRAALETQLGLMA